jgi:hypothetical protein
MDIEAGKPHLQPIPKIWESADKTAERLEKMPDNRGKAGWYAGSAGMGGTGISFTGSATDFLATIHMSKISLILQGNALR